MRLRDDPRLLTIAVRRVADQTGIPAAHIEKDFWLTEALRRMAAVADAERFTLLFKGGTSLSKAFRLIERFSEDVDVLVVLPTGSKGEQDRLLRRLIDEAAMGCGLSAFAEPSGTTKAVKRGCATALSGGSRHSRNLGRAADRAGLPGRHHAAPTPHHSLPDR